MLPRTGAAEEDTLGRQIENRFMTTVETHLWGEAAGRTETCKREGPLRAENESHKQRPRGENGGGV